MLQNKSYLALVAITIILAGCGSESPTMVAEARTAGTGGIVAIIGGSAPLLVDSDGQLWQWAPHLECWTEVTVEIFPVPARDVKLWSERALVTTANEVWYRNGGEWVNCGAWPGR
jgi:hypothetical protein